MKDVMIDVETLDTRPSTVILSIGAILFDIEQPAVFGDSIHLHIDIDSCLNAGCTVSGSTLLWWLSQNDDARNALVQAQRIPLNTALLRLAAFIPEDARVWGNGSAFDNVIVASAYNRMGIPLPWKYWNDMCYRTIKALNPQVPKPAFEGVKHDALADAKNQARHLQLIYDQVRLRTGKEDKVQVY